MSAWMSSAALRQVAGQGLLVAERGQPRAAVGRDPAHHLGRGEVLRLAADLPDAPVRLVPAFQRPLHLLACHLPGPVVEPVARFGVQVDRVEDHAPDVVLRLLVGAVADAHRPGALVAVQVVEHVLVEIAAAVDAVDDLQVTVVAFDQVAEEGDVVVGLPLEAEGVQAPQRERGIAHPGVAVVPVALAARRLRQRGGGRGGDSAGGRERQALERQRAAGQVAAPAVVGEAAAGQPVLPVVRGPHQPPVGVLVVQRRVAMPPGQRDEAGIALLQQGPAPGSGSLQAEADVGGQGERQVQALRLDDGLGVAAIGVPPARVLPAVVEGGHAVQGELGLAVHAAHRAQQHVLGVVVGGRPDVRAAVGMVVLPGPHHQAIPHDEPALAAVPAGLQDQGAGQVAAVAGHRHVVRAEPEPPRVPVQDRAEDARAVHRRQAHPLDRSARRHQRGDLAVGQERVVRDRRVGRELVDAARRPIARAVRQRLERHRVLCCHFNHLSSHPDR